MSYDIQTRQSNIPRTIVTNLTYSLADILYPLNKVSYYSTHDRELPIPESPNYMTDYTTLVLPKYMAANKYDQALKNYSNSLHNKIMQKFVNICKQHIDAEENITSKTENLNQILLNKPWDNVTNPIFMIGKEPMNFPTMYTKQLHIDDLEMNFLLATILAPKHRSVTLMHTPQTIQEIDDTMLAFSSIISIEFNHPITSKTYKRISI